MTRIATLAVVVLMSAGLTAQGGGRGGAQAPPAAAQAALDKALASLQGTWVINDINGQAPPSMLLVFKADKYEQVVDGTVNEKGTIKLDAAKKPMALDLVIQEGSDAGKLQLGIVEVTGETMKLKLAFPSETTRPKEFTQEETALMVNLTKRK
jgi:uncharacterized protein (TIGR03067 family)